MNRAGFPLWLLAGLLVAYALPGILGHDPWKPDEPYTFGIALHMLRTDDWLVPSVAGVPFVEKPPLYYWLAALAMKWGGAILPLHDAARVSSLAWLGLSVAAVGAAARVAWGAGAGVPAILVLLGTLGLEGHAQRMQVDLALMAGFAVATLGLAACTQARAWAGAAIGAGVAIGFLAKGVVAPAGIALGCAMLALLFEGWRTRYYAQQLAIAAAIALPAMAIWPVLLGLRSPDLFDEWFWANNVGRFTGYTTQRLGANASHGFWLATLPWFLFPVWVFALAALWRERRNFWDLPALQAGIALAAGTAILLGISASARSVYALPLLPPLAVAAVAGMRPPFGVLDRLLTVLAIALAIVALAAVWAIWLVLVVDGRVPDFVPAARWLPPVFDMQVRVALVAGAAALTAGFVFLVAFHRRVVHGALALWVGAIALAWGLAHTLWLPWLDHGRSYRGLYGEIKAQLPRDTRCILMQGVPESERALIEYYIGIPPRHRHDREQDCAALLWKGIVQDNPIHIWPGPQWRFAWRGQRPGEKLEGFDLFLRKNDGG